MQIHKPDTLNFATQPVDWQGQLRQSFTITLGVDLNAPGGAVLPIEQAYAAAMQALGQGDCLDMGLPKKQAEWLLAGNACAPHGQTSAGLVVDIRVGASKRRFLADSEKPVAEIPLTWAQTWGTEAENPQGLKSGKVKRAPLTDAALPFGAPACPGPRGVWPCRMGHMGTYDANWLKTRWPGVPDDFDWIFYNLAQPQQFLPNGLKEDEEIELAGLHPDHPRIVCRLPGKTPHLFLTRTNGDGKESEVKLQADTLWLFPNQLAGLLFWHGMAPCADESATDIQIARLTLEPEEPAAAAAEAGAGAEAPPPPPPEPPPAAAAPPPKEPAAAVADSSGGISGTTIAGVAVGVAGAAGAAFAVKKHHDKKEEQKKAAEAQKKAEEQKKQETPKTPESAAAQPGEKSPATAQSPETAQSPAAQPARETTPASANLQAELQQQLTESLPEINQGLAEAGLPPLTPEQIAETRAHLNAYAAQIQEIEARANQPQPELDEVLRQAGLPEDRIRAVQAALDLEMPDPAQAASPQEWSAAVDGYVRRFADLLQPSDEVLHTMRTTMLIQGPGGDKVLEEMAGGPPPTPVQQLVQAGLRPDQAAGLVSALEADIPEGKDGLMLYAKQIEQAAGFPEGSVSDHIKAYQEVMDKIMAEHPELAAAEAQKSAEAAQTAETSAKADAGKTAAATEAAGKTTETTKTAATDAAAKPAQQSGPPKDRAGVLALLAGGGSLAGLALAGMNLSGLDLSGQDMSGTDLTGANLQNAMLDQAALGQGKLAGADLSGASLAGANLAGADLSGAKAESTVFRQANLSGADLSGITAPDADFTASNLAGADLGKGSFKGADFGEAQGPGLKAESADFTSAGLRFCSMPEAQFAGSRFGGADIHQSVMDRAVFRQAQLADARFCAGTSVAGADFAGADMTGTLWSGARAPGASFTGVTAKGASFADCDLAACRWPGADLRESDFSRTGLAGAEMRGVNLFKASLREADLSRTNLAQANLYGADLCRAKIDPSTQLAGADHTNTILAAREAV